MNSEAFYKATFKDNGRMDITEKTFSYFYGERRQKD